MVRGRHTIRYFMSNVEIQVFSFWQHSERQTGGAWDVVRQRDLGRMIAVFKVIQTSVMLRSVFGPSSRKTDFQLLSGPSNLLRL